jgi:hypothetical protein
VAEERNIGPSCPKCGGTVWDVLLGATANFGGMEHVACAACGLMGTLTFDGFEADRIQDTRGLVRVELGDLLIEPLGSGVKLTHAPSGIVVEARAYPTAAENQRAALQALALQLLDARGA